MTLHEHTIMVLVIEMQGHALEEATVALGELCDDAVLWVNEDQVIVGASSNALSLLEYPRDKLIGTELGKVLSIKDEVEKRGKSSHYAFLGELRTESGSVVNVLVKYEPVTINDTSLSVYLISKANITCPEKTFLTLLSALSKEAIFITRDYGTIIWLNKAAEQMFGYARSELLGKKFYDYLPVDREEFVALINTYMNSTMREDESKLKKAELRRKDGSTFIAELSHSVVEVNNTHYAIAIIRDITEVEQAQLQSMREREKLDMIMNNMLNMVIVIQDENIAYANRAAESITGYKVDELIGMYFLKIFDSEYHAQLSENYRRRMLGMPVPEEYSVPILTKGGKRKWIYLHAKIIDYDGKPADLVSIMDISEIWAREQKLLAIDNMARKINLATSKNEVYEMVLNTVVKSLGFEHAAIAELEHDKLVFVNTAGDYESAPASAMRAHLNGVSKFVVYGQPYYVHNVEDEEYTEYIAPFSTGSEVYGALLVKREGRISIEEHEQVLIDLIVSHLSVAIRSIEYITELKSSRDLNELLLRLIGHDLKTPLAVIEGYAQLLNKEYNPEYVGEIKNAVDLSMSFIDRAKMLSRLNVRRAKLDLSRVNINSIVREIVSLMEKKYGMANVSVEGEDVSIVGNGFLLRELLFNIIDNAIKHGADSVVVRIHKASKHVEIRVADNGPGIPEDKRAHIFEPFVKYGKDGTGLGLAIARKIVELHRGQIQIEDNEPRGSVFVIEMPTQ